MSVAYLGGCFVLSVQGAFDRSRVRARVTVSGRGACRRLEDASVREEEVAGAMVATSVDDVEEAAAAAAAELAGGVVCLWGLLSLVAQKQPIDS